jgi:hypothetical protein
MIHGRSRTALRKHARHFLLTITLGSVCCLQGCATSIETLGLGVGIGIASTIGMATCAITCR